MLKSFAYSKHLKFSSKLISNRSILYIPDEDKHLTMPLISFFLNGVRLWMTTRFGISVKDL